MSTTIVNHAKLGKLTKRQKNEASDLVGRFIDISVTSTGKGTYYNTKKEQDEAEALVHKSLIGFDRSLYGALLCLPTQERAKQLAINNFLEEAGNGSDTIFNIPESRIISFLSNQITPARLLKTYGVIKKSRINNSRARRLILSSILSSPNLEWWSVKYRSKIRAALMHAWGQKMFSIIHSILGKLSYTDKEKGILAKNFDKYCNNENMPLRDVYECIHFVGDVKGSERHSLSLLRKFEDAKSDINLGIGLPPEVLEGIRSKFHPSVTKERVLELCKNAMTGKQKVQKQKKLKEAGIEVKADFDSQDSVSLYIYAYEVGLTKELEDVLDKKARENARFYPRYQKVGILLDASGSQFGSSKQKLRPMAVSMSIVDALRHSGETHALSVVGGKKKDGLIFPDGATNLATFLLDLAEQNCDIIYVVSDGYENSPLGRFAEMVDAIRKVGFSAPIMHLNPVMSAEAVSVKKLHKSIDPTPCNNPTQFGLSILKAQLSGNFDAGIEMLADKARKLLN